MNISNTNNLACTAHISVNKNRIKIYGTSEQSVFLKDSQNFEIELHNPKQNSVLAKILINGRSISSSGFVLRPGQRVYIERFVDEPKKFVFSTYEVSDNYQNMKAIENNGLVEVQFYDEYVSFSASSYWYSNTYPTYTYSNGTPLTNGILNLNGTALTGITSATTNTAFASINTNVAGSFSNTLETGRIEIGESSDQKFETVYGNFNSWASSTQTIKMFPISQKPVDNLEVRNYCTNCGTRAKNTSWKFCPKCGGKF